MEELRRLLILLLCFFILFASGCSDTKKTIGKTIREATTTEEKRQENREAEEVKKRQEQAEVQHQQEQAEAQRRQKEEVKRRQEIANVFQYSDFTLYHKYNEIIPYNGIKMSFVVQNNSSSVQLLRLSDFVLQKKGNNTILPEKALRGYTGIARNPDNPDFSEYDNVLNQREMYPGDRFFIKIEFWEQRELIRSLEGWTLVHMYNNNVKNICTLHD